MYDRGSRKILIAFLGRYSSWRVQLYFSICGVACDECDPNGADPLGCGMTTTASRGAAGQGRLLAIPGDTKTFMTKTNAAERNTTNEPRQGMGGGPASYFV